MEYFGWRLVISAHSKCKHPNFKKIETGENRSQSFFTPTPIQPSNGKITAGFDENVSLFPYTNYTYSLMKNRQKLLSWFLMTVRESIWAPLGVVVSYLVVKAFDGYLLYPPLDIPTHFLGGVAIAYFYRSAITNSQKLVGSIPLPVQSLLTLTCTGTTTILWEFFEYSSDLFFHTNMVLGLEDTLKDMFMGLLGGLILLLLTPKARSSFADTSSD